MFLVKLGEPASRPEVQRFISLSRGRLFVEDFVCVLVFKVEEYIMQVDCCSKLFAAARKISTSKHPLPGVSNLRQCACSLYYRHLAGAAMYPPRTPRR